MRAMFIAALIAALALLVAPITALECHGAGYDFSSLTYSDYVLFTPTNNDTYYFRPCGNVTAPACASRPSMLCQTDPYGGVYDLAFYYGQTTTSQTDWTPVNINGTAGVRMTLADGDLCGTNPRRLIVNFLCQANLGAQQALFTSIAEGPQCTYTANVYTSIVCPGITNPSTCGAYGYDLTSLATRDLSYIDTRNNYTWWYRPCGTVTATQCAQNPNGGVAGEAMMCQAVGTAGQIAAAFDVAVWNPSLATWARSAGGNQGGGNSGAGRTLSMTIEDGASCGGYPRSLEVRYVCTPSATPAYMSYVTEVSTCSYIAYVNTTLVCANPSPVSQAVACGGIYNLNQMSQRDLTYRGTDGFNYIIRPCGAVADIQCSRNPAAGVNTSMICQAQQNSNTAYALATWDPNAVSYYPTLQGIRMDIQDGAYCAVASMNRKVSIHFICGNNPFGTFLNFTEVTTCNYVGYVSTSLVCSGQRTGYCGSGSYDFTLASTSNDLTYIDGNYKWFLRPCGQVIAPVCNDNPDTQNSMLCQNNLGSRTTYDVAFYDENLVYWNRIANGWQMFVQDGATCGQDVPRALTINFICASGTASFVNITEVSGCNYVGYVLTPQACAPTSSTGLQNVGSGVGTGVYDYEEVSHCGGPYDLSSLSTQDISYDNVAANVTWVLRPCGRVSDPRCLANTRTNNAMMCQVRDQDSVTYDVANYLPEYVSYNPTRTGLNMTIQDGDYCGATASTARKLTVMYDCDATATTARLVSVIETSICVYVARVMTNLVCPRTGVTCGGAGYDLSALTTRGDLFLADDGSSNHWYFSPCGTVQNSQCTRSAVTENSMMCQVNQYNTTYNVATYIPQAITWTAITNGVQMSVQDGQTCGDNVFERKLIVNFICGAGFYQFVRITEGPICQYTATINTGLACSGSNQPTTSSSSTGASRTGPSSVTVSISSPSAVSSSTTTPSRPSSSSTGTIIAGGDSSSSSSSLSGGAIAGIVIGSIVGALILLGIVFVLCCGVGGWAASKKSSSTDDGPRATGKFNEIEASEVEMQGADETHDNNIDGESEGHTA